MRPRHTRETRRPPRAPHGANPSMAPKRGSKVQKVSHETRAPTRGSKKTRRIEETPNILTRSIFFLPLLYVIYLIYERVGAGRVDLHPQTTNRVSIRLLPKPDSGMALLLGSSRPGSSPEGAIRLSPRARAATPHPPMLLGITVLRADPNTAIQLVRGASRTQ